MQNLIWLRPELNSVSLSRLQPALGTYGICCTTPRIQQQRSSDSSTPNQKITSNLQVSSLSQMKTKQMMDALALSNACSYGFRINEECWDGGGIYRSQHTFLKSHISLERHPFGPNSTYSAEQLCTGTFLHKLKGCTYSRIKEKYSGKNS